MSDTDKIKLIGRIIADCLEYPAENQLEGYYLGLLYAIDSVVNFVEGAE